MEENFASARVVWPAAGGVGAPGWSAMQCVGCSARGLPNGCFGSGSRQDEIGAEQPRKRRWRNVEADLAL